MEHVCPSCAAAEMHGFYETCGVPVHSCVLFDDAQAAVDHPTRDVKLAFCRACGFITNVAFDETALQYAEGYEDQQCHSARFRAFQTGLVERLVERYGLRGKDVIEVGCGKGDFLNELCEAGGNRGIGIDPACGQRGAEGGRVRFLAAQLDQEHAALPCDLLCCRHTLEHIHAVREFVRLTRRVVAGRGDAVVFFEVPETGRVLRERAFWDIYYEHCSYFTPGSLARMFAANGFEIDEVRTDYDDQYLLLAARSTDRPAAVVDDQGDVAKTARQVEEFAVSVERQLSDWRERIARFHERGQRIAIWGSGSKCVAFLAATECGDAVDAIVDINPMRHGKYLPGSGRRIDSPDSLQSLSPDVVVAMNAVYRDEIGQALADRGLRPELLAV